MSLYDVNAANTARIVRFHVEPTNAGDRAANLFKMLRGLNPAHPHYGQTTAPTGLQSAAQLRLSLVVRALTRYAPVIGVVTTTDAGSNADGALVVTFELDEQGTFFNNAWPTNPTGVAKHKVTDIADTVGIGGMNSPKTKPGLQTILDSLYNVSYDNGVTGPFGNLSGASGGTGSLTMPDGTVVASLPHLDNNGSGVTTLSGLTVTLVTPV